MAVRRRFESGVWLRVLPGVVRMFWADDSWLLRCRAALVWAGKSGALSHVTAARLLGFDVEPHQQVHITTRRGYGVLRTKDFQSHRPLGRPDTVRIDGLRVTSPARTMVDLAATFDETALTRILRLALRNGQLRRPALEAELGKLTRGHRGSRKLRSAFEQLVREGAV